MLLGNAYTSSVVAVLKQCHGQSLRCYPRVNITVIQYRNQASNLSVLVPTSRCWDLAGVHTQNQEGERRPIRPDPRAVIKIKMAYEGEGGEGWETGREKCIEFI